MEGVVVSVRRVRTPPGFQKREQGSGKEVWEWCVLPSLAEEDARAVG